MDKSETCRRKKLKRKLLGLCGGERVKTVPELYEIFENVGMIDGEHSIQTILSDALDFGITYEIKRQEDYFIEKRVMFKGEFVDGEGSEIKYRVYNENIERKLGEKQSKDWFSELTI